MQCRTRGCEWREITLVKYRCGMRPACALTFDMASFTGSIIQSNDATVRTCRMRGELEIAYKDRKSSSQKVAIERKIAKSFPVFCTMWVMQNKKITKIRVWNLNSQK
jgi:hypothetical protein